MFPRIPGTGNYLGSLCYMHHYHCKHENDIVTVSLSINSEIFIEVSMFHLVISYDRMNSSGCIDKIHLVL